MFFMLPLKKNLNILSFFFRKMLMSAFFLRFKANCIPKKWVATQTFLWIPTALAKIYIFHVVLTWYKNLCI